MPYDVAASELYEEDKKAYYFPGESFMTGTEVYRTAEEMTAYYEELTETFPVFIH